MPDMPTPPPIEQPAQKPTLSQTLLRGLKDVAVDPTTYAPALSSYGSMKADWDTSQPLFNNGYMEANPKFTQTGQPNSAPMSYADGMSSIRGRALGNLAKQAGNNALVDVLSRKMMERFPDHQRLIKGLSWAEKAGVSGLSSYLGSANHLSQIQKNKDMLAGMRQ